jgi:tetratricopeptide (TPR) repeat protein
VYQVDLRNATGASQAAAYIARGLAYETEKDYDRAIADYSEAIQLGNKSALMYDTRGRAYLYAGALTKALADFDKASELNPKNPYAALWLDICNRRSDIPSVLTLVRLSALKFGICGIPLSFRPQSAQEPFPWFRASPGCDKFGDDVPPE